MEITWRDFNGEGRNGGKEQGIRSINGRHKIDGEAKNSIGNRSHRTYMSMDMN